MGTILGGFVLPLLLLMAGVMNWSLISLINLMTSLFFRFTAPKRGVQFRGRILSLWFLLIYSALVVCLQVAFLILRAIMGSSWIFADSWWIKLIGLMTIQSWKSPTALYFMVVELLVGLVAIVEIHRNNFGLFESQESCWGYLSSVVEHIGYRLRLVSCLLLPAVQLAVGISNPSWLSLPFFIGSCVGLVDWSLTSNFLGLFRWWKLLWVYAGLSICLLYIYQFHFVFPQTIQGIINSIGLYKVSVDCDWQEICSGISLMAFYYTLSCVKHDLEDMEFIMSMREGSLTEQLLPSRNSFFVRQLRSGVYALSYWSFHFASICAFGLFAYVGYILCAFPSLFRLHRLNRLLLVFILLWSVSTYIFNVAFAYVNWKLGKDIEIWEMVGLWHYPIHGFFLLAQFCLGILVALCRTSACRFTKAIAGGNGATQIFLNRIAAQASRFDHSTKQGQLLHPTISLPIIALLAINGNRTRDLGSDTNCRTERLLLYQKL